MPPEAKSQLDEIDRLINEPVPVPKPRSTARKAAPVPVEVDDSDEADGGDDLAPVSRVAPVPVAATVPGLPSIEAVTAVAEARAAVARLAEQRAAVAAEIANTEGTLGLRPNASARDVEALAVRLLAAGKSDDDVTRLDALRVRLRRLVGAEELAAKALFDAQQQARRELSGPAADVEFRPAARRSALALREPVRAQAEVQDARTRLRAGGFVEPPLTFWADILDPYHNPTLLVLVRDGHLTGDEVKAVAPHLGGI